MPNTKFIEEQSGKKIREITLKEGTDNVYIVVLENNLEQDWEYNGNAWKCLG